MNRRRLIAIATTAAAWPFAARAQQTAKMPRIGWLVTGALDAAETRALLDAFRQGLAEHGYFEGRNITFEIRTAAGRIERFPPLAKEIVDRKVDLIVVGNTAAARAARQASATIPIVVSVMGDPIGDGLVASLARPGGNVTGLTFLGPELTPKRLALLKEALPKVSRVAALWHPGAFGERTMREMLRETEVAARALGVALRFVEVRGPDEIESAFAAMAAEGPDALFIFPSPMLFNERRRIVELATRHRLPSMALNREFVDLGALISYGANISDLFRRSATYVDKILKGAKPGDLPIEQPTKFELFVNLKTAKALGLAIPTSILVQADEVIE